MSAATCPAQTGPVWKFGGEPCGCMRPAGHAGDHRCSCGSWWVDSVRRDCEHSWADVTEVQHADRHLICTTCRATRQEPR